jgi:16S rRNA (adenine1518-N6/adenine1519-N6)-dimethyltransferase
MTLTARQVADLLTTHGLRPSRALGQNFVIDPNTVRRIVRLAEIKPGDRVLEIGPGLGSLTGALADAGAQVTAVEIDHRLIPVLEAVLGAAPVRVVRGDALRIDWADLLGSDPGWLLVANLPYNIATPLIATILDEVPAVARLVIMVQREVAERLAAHPGHRDYGAVSVKVAYWAEAEVVAHVPPTVFIPRPKVESSLVSIRRRDAPAVDPDRVSTELLFRLVQAGFAKRRKMLRRSLAGLVPPGAFAAAEVRPEARAENLDVYAWGRLAAAVQEASSAASAAVTAPVRDSPVPDRQESDLPASDLPESYSRASESRESDSRASESGESDLPESDLPESDLPESDLLESSESPSPRSPAASDPTPRPTASDDSSDDAGLDSAPHPAPVAESASEAGPDAACITDAAPDSTPDSAATSDSPADVGREPRPDPPLGADKGPEPRSDPTGMSDAVADPDGRWSAFAHPER